MVGRDRANLALVLRWCFEPEPGHGPELMTRDGDSLANAAAPGDDEPASAQGLLVGAPSASGGDAAEASLATGALDGFVLPPRPIPRPSSSPWPGFLWARTGPKQKRMRLGRLWMTGHAKSTWSSTSAL